VLGLASLILVDSGCRAGVGGHCEKGEARCLDGVRALACESGQFIEVPCRGAKGCAAGPNSIACDIEGSRAGDRCSRDEEGTAVCAGAQALMACRDGHFVSSPCRGRKGCALLGAQALCDASVGVPGEACREDGKKACAVDGSVVLECKNHALSSLYLCRGPKGCALVEGKLDCDMSVAAEGDACDKRLEGHVACSPDHAATVVCKGGRFAADEKCKKGLGCSAEANQTHCIKS
jgi:hypothetical protein